jgi:hypothetical protein
VVTVGWCLGLDGSVESVERNWVWGVCFFFGFRGVMVVFWFF